MDGHCVASSLGGYNIQVTAHSNNIASSSLFLFSWYTPWCCWPIEKNSTSYSYYIHPSIYKKSHHTPKIEFCFISFHWSHSVSDHHVDQHVHRHLIIFQPQFYYVLVYIILREKVSNRFVINDLVVRRSRVKQSVTNSWGSLCWMGGLSLCCVILTAKQYSVCLCCAGHPAV
jgi:hypothetical protein